MSKVLAGVEPDNGLKANKRLLQLLHIGDVVTCNIQERRPFLTFLAVKGNRYICVSAKTR